MAKDAGLGYRYLVSPLSQLSVRFPFKEHFRYRLDSPISFYYFYELLYILSTGLREQATAFAQLKELLVGSLHHSL